MLQRARQQAVVAHVDAQIGQDGAQVRVAASLAVTVDGTLDVGGTSAGFAGNALDQNPGALRE